MHHKLFKLVKFYLSSSAAKNKFFVFGENLRHCTFKTWHWVEVYYCWWFPVIWNPMSNLGAGLQPLCHFVATALPSRCHCTATSLLLTFRFHCIAISMPLHCHFVATALPSHCHCAVILLPLHCHLIATALSFRCHCTAISLPLQCLHCHLAATALLSRC